MHLWPKNARPHPDLVAGYQASFPCQAAFLWAAPPVPPGARQPARTLAESHTRSDGALPASPACPPMGVPVDSGCRPGRARQPPALWGPPDGHRNAARSACDVFFSSRHREGVLAPKEIQPTACRSVCASARRYRLRSGIPPREGAAKQSVESLAFCPHSR
ncbi:uncharacterized protein UV8b_05965 [Ustilaginoidea virens]|uniref:Uncharacterized protein n=1 Tax=Ustilaginoidea virens TaxID=1159556 RepID=A0A8E5MJ54_USTVR|nr:uncharacterized protein UV8b_05965 [Ustilaginoidea virens]QUC21722.1 hypothetical protein UV8b_05965 [Ustilaginoidea virens]